MQFVILPGGSADFSFVSHLPPAAGDFSVLGFDPGTFPRTTLPALALAVAAYRRDDATGEAVSLALRDALFERGRDISRPEVLAELADAHGLAPAEAADGEAVLADWRAGQDRGVKGSPHFFCGAHEAFCPSLELSRDEHGHLRLRRDVERLNAFLEVCLAS